MQYPLNSRLSFFFLLSVGLFLLLWLTTYSKAASLCPIALWLSDTPTPLRSTAICPASPKRRVLSGLYTHSDFFDLKQLVLL